MKLLLVALLIFISRVSFAQEDPEKIIYKPKFEIGAYTGTLLLSDIDQVVDNVPPFLVKFGWNSHVGSFELSLLNARGNDMHWRSGLLDYRFDLDDLNLPFHALFGFQMDAYQIYDGETTYFGGGWHYGGGAHFEIVPHVNFRADFVNRFGPGRSLLVEVGLSIGLGDAKENQ